MNAAPGALSLAAEPDPYLNSLSIQRPLNIRIVHA
jgi:hypothetical protein